MTAKSDGVQANHTDDADAAQKVKSMVTFLHECKGSEKFRVEGLELELFLYRPDKHGIFST